MKNPEEVEKLNKVFQIPGQKLQKTVTASRSLEYVAAVNYVKDKKIMCIEKYNDEN